MLAEASLVLSSELLRRGGKGRVVRAADCSILEGISQKDKTSKQQLERRTCCFDVRENKHRDTVLGG